MDEVLLRSLLDYSPETGHFTWKVSRGSRVKPGDVAGSPDKDGYVLVGINGRKWRAHRLAWFWVHGSMPPEQIDHINSDPADNRISNLRLASGAQNNENRTRCASHNRSGFLGVKKNSRYTWAARITVRGDERNLGSFRSPEDAHAAYVEAKRQFHEYGVL